MHVFVIIIFPWPENNEVNLQVFFFVDVLFHSTGNGPYLTLHSATNGVLLNSKNLLPRSRIHGVRGEQRSKNIKLYNYYRLKFFLFA